MAIVPAFAAASAAVADVPISRSCHRSICQIIEFGGEFSTLQRRRGSSLAAPPACPRERRASARRGTPRHTRQRDQSGWVSAGAGQGGGGLAALPARTPEQREVARRAASTDAYYREQSGWMPASAG